MKTLLLTVCLFGAVSAVAQNGTLIDNQAHPIQMNEHPVRAAQQPLTTEQTLLIQNPFTYAHGERPMWEFATNAPVEPLGDIARRLKEDHTVAKKSDTVFINY